MKTVTINMTYGGIDTDYTDYSTNYDNEPLELPVGFRNYLIAQGLTYTTQGEIRIANGGMSFHEAMEFMAQVVEEYGEE